jgi:hypothetical protein
VHPFWLSHEENRAWLRLLIGGQPWPELELHAWPSGLTGEEGRGKGRWQRAEGVAIRGAMGGRLMLSPYS